MTVRLILSLALASLLTGSPTSAKNLGVVGAVYSIAEIDALNELEDMRLIFCGIKYTRENGKLSAIRWKFR